MCEHCKAVRRRGKVYIVCSANKKHKQRQRFHTLAPSALSHEEADISLSSMAPGSASAMLSDPSPLSTSLSMHWLSQAVNMWGSNISRAEVTGVSETSGNVLLRKDVQSLIYLPSSKH
ncbi:hypothetical protein GUITHDRAFT_151258 [Guillardia theta CCMP2712]|uniref:Ribosomal protein n=1 Tax=Guillardia theta (strain CCMP2712) TaxID=905079 RepID=L1JNS8_GUITC|nr:hypothetical protein GUITHDRAFT_151258 [Guillardia theta CCMP2712]EKX50236.1 hypothetical protein GUITHDRAFT_151258 [Guillardia theta CCMP2712]|eukprot:XP_005837216.1 hypothetical protein GUITHDRAFT_151258 [Guillardia theta CCMP2712]